MSVSIPPAGKGRAYKPETGSAVRRNIVNTPCDHLPCQQFAGFCQTRIKTQGINMLNYERHLLVVTVIALIVIVVAVAAIVLEVPLPFIGKG